MNILNLLFTIAAVPALVCVIVLVIKTAKSAKRLDERIDEYRQEPLPSDPQAELLKIIADRSHQHAFRREGDNESDKG